MAEQMGTSRSRKKRLDGRAEASPESRQMISYIADMCAELAGMAGTCDQPMLVYFLNLARVEAEIRARGGGALSLDAEQ